MLDVQDELTDLAAALGCLTGIRSLLRVIGEVVEPAEASGGEPARIESELLLRSSSKDRWMSI